MPTGYTADIVDGKITEFNQFAKQCIRAFGATIHMRDEPSNIEYKKREPSDYHSKAITEAERKINEAKMFTDVEIIVLKTRELNESKKYHLDSIKKIKEAKVRLEGFLEHANKYVPPTEEHIGIKEFMIQQLVDTIKHDGSTKYHDDYLLKVEAELKNIDVDKIRKHIIKEAKEKIVYHKKELAAEIKRCDDSNKWVEDFLKSLNKK